MIAWTRPVVARLASGKACAYAYDATQPNRHVFAIANDDAAALVKAAHYMRMGGCLA